MRVERERWRLLEPFHITGTVMEELDVVVVELSDDGHCGRGEAAGVDYRIDDSIEHMLGQLHAIRGRVESGIDRTALQSLLPPGGARNAVDCALWELDARRTGQAVWQLAGLKPPRPLLTTYTIGANDPSAMAATAKRFTHARAIKLKLTGETCDAERVRSVRAVRPDVWLGVDANQGFTRAHFDALLPVLIQTRVCLIEQPFRVGLEPPLSELNSPIPIAADESIQGLADLHGAAERFNVINIKLDKCGGLTEGLAMARMARQLQLGIMVGNMVGTSLAMAPAFVVGQLCDVVDLDGPILLASDRAQTVEYVNGEIWCAANVWGGADMSPAS
jgi:L-alanine-DL-glutamate epimerase-like enolase superfamily enzyme